MDLTFDVLAALIVLDYKNNGRRNIYNLEKSIVLPLQGLFAGLHASEITTTAVEATGPGGWTLGPPTPPSTGSWRP